jgi:hypothetical protein
MPKRHRDLGRDDIFDNHKRSDAAARIDGGMDRLLPGQSELPVARDGVKSLSAVNCPLVPIFLTSA